MISDFVTPTKGVSKTQTSDPKNSDPLQARNQDLKGGGGANETKVDQTTEIYFLSNSF